MVSKKAKAKLKTELLFTDFFNLYSLFMSAKAAHSVIVYLCKLERTQGYKGLSGMTKHVAEVILQLHSTHGKRGLRKIVNRYNFGIPPELRIFLLISLRSNGKGGLEKAMQLVHSKGHYFADPPDNSHVVRKAHELSRKPDPFESFDLETAGRKPTERGTRYLNLYQRVPDPIRILIEQHWGEELDFSYPYPYRTDKKLMIKKGKTISHHKVIPADIIKSLDECPHLVYLHYDYVKYVIGDWLPPRDHFKSGSGHQDIVGTINPLIKDAGCKVRDIFNVKWPVALLCYPLHMRLKKILGAIECSYILNQDGGVDWAAQKLKEGKKLSSIDISTASDNIPLSCQIREMQEILLDSPWAHDMISLFYYACRAKWVSPFKNKDTYVRLLKGSPMGIPGSYNGFSLHLIWGLLLRGVPLEEFAVVGDDLIIVSDYDSNVRSFFQQEGIPVSELKSIWSSDTLAEFCGRLITKFGALRFGKSKRFSEDNPLTSVAKYGKQAFKLSSLPESDKSLLKFSAYKAQHQGWIEQFIPELEEVEVPAMGGYTPNQLLRMGLLERKSFNALMILIGLMYTPDRDDFQNFLKGTFEIERVKRDKTSKKIVSKVRQRFVLEESLPLPVEKRELSFWDSLSIMDSPITGKNIVWQSSLSPNDSLDSMIEACLDYLNTEVNKKQLCQLSKSRPSFVSGSVKRLFRSLAASEGVSDDIRHERLLAARILKQRWSVPETVDVAKSTILAWYNEAGLPQRAVAPSADLIEPSVLATQLADGMSTYLKVQQLVDDISKSVPESELPWYKHFINNNFLRLW